MSFFSGPPKTFPLYWFHDKENEKYAVVLCPDLLDSSRQALLLLRDAGYNIPHKDWLESGFPLYSSGKFSLDELRLLDKYIRFKLGEWGGGQFRIVEINESFLSTINLELLHTLEDMKLKRLKRYPNS